jgi:hypothetical protein
MKNAICIGCGCDEIHACVIPARCEAGAEVCWWMRFDAARKTGVCSACEDLRKGWDQGQHQPILTLIAERYYRQVLFLYDDRAAALLWMRSPQPILKGRSPRDLILEDRLEEVQTVLDLYRDGAFA